MKKILLLLGLLLCVASQMMAQDKVVPMYRIGGQPVGGINLVHT